MLLVTGAPRSGTTYIGDWVSQSPDAYCAHEILPLLEGADDERILAVLRRCAETGEDRLGKPLQREFLRWPDHSPKPSPRLLGLKEPVRWPVSGDALPYPVGGFLEARDTRYVFVVRHPYDVIASGRRRARTTRNWPGYDLDAHAGLWRAALRWSERLREEGRPTLLLRFEDLLLDRDGARRALEAHLDLELPDFDGFERTPEELAAMRAGASREAGLPGLAHRALLGPDDRARLAELLAPDCDRLGYRL